MKKLLLILFWTIIVQSCTTTKKTTEITTVAKTNDVAVVSTASVDTTHTITKTVYVPVKSDINLTSLCDSLGNLKSIDISTTIGNFKARITSLNNNLNVKFEQLDSIISVNEKLTIYSQIKDSINQILTSKIESKKDSKKIIYKPTKWTYIFFFAFLAVTYMLLSKWRKLIPTIF